MIKCNIINFTDIIEHSVVQNDIGKSLACRQTILHGGKIQAMDQRITMFEGVQTP